MVNVRLMLLIGQYAQRRYLKSSKKTKFDRKLSRAYKEYLPEYFVLPHPSPRNFIWKSKNPWFEQEVLPKLKSRVHSIIH